MRQSRKLDHLKYSIELADGPVSNQFEDISLIHNCLPDADWQDIALSGSIGGIPFSHPLIINAITGGAEDVTKINEHLAELAARTDTIMAVGSQYAAIENPETCNSFKIVRKKNPNGIILANLSAHVKPQQAVQAVDMLNAQGLQIHLNVAQELIMKEGDRQFKGYLENIAQIVKQLKVPVIVKEVGCGIAMDQALKIAQTGVKAIDIGGAGGTNFLAIEAARNRIQLSPDLLRWGIPTAISTVEVAAASVQLPFDIMVSGGIRTPLEAIKALVLGGCAIGVAAPFLKILNKHDLNEAEKWITQFLNDMKMYMLLLGCSRLPHLWEVPVVITGYSRDWLLSRGIDIHQYAIRKKHG